MLLALWMLRAGCWKESCSGAAVYETCRFGTRKTRAGRGGLTISNLKSEISNLRVQIRGLRGRRRTKATKAATAARAEGSGAGAAGAGTNAAAANAPGPS